MRNLYGSCSIQSNTGLIAGFLKTNDASMHIRVLQDFVNLTYNNQANQLLFGTEAIRDALAHVLQSENQDGQRWAASAFGDLTNNNAANKVRFGTNEVRDAFKNTLAQ